MSKEKLQELRKEIEIPQDLEVEVENNEVIAKKENNEIRRKFPKIEVVKEENKIVIKAKKSTKRERKQVNTIVAHIKNIFQGLQEKFVYRLQICSIHFPMNVSVKDREVIIRNFLGETKERKAKILPNVEVKVENDIVIVESVDKESAGQTASNIELATKIKGRDKRIFQDGVYLVSRAGRKI